MGPRPASAQSSKASKYTKLNEVKPIFTGPPQNKEVQAALDAAETGREYYIKKVQNKVKVPKDMAK